MMRGRNNAEVTHQTDREVSVGKQLPFFPKKILKKHLSRRKKLRDVVKFFFLFNCSSFRKKYYFFTVKIKKIIKISSFFFSQKLC